MVKPWLSHFEFPARHSTELVNYTEFAVSGKTTRTAWTIAMNSENWWTEFSSVSRLILAPQFNFALLLVDQVDLEVSLVTCLDTSDMCPCQPWESNGLPGQCGLTGSWIPTPGLSRYRTPITRTSTHFTNCHPNHTVGYIYNIHQNGNNRDVSGDLRTMPDWSPTQWRR